MPDPSNALLYGFLALLLPTILAALRGVRSSAKDQATPISSRTVLLGLAIWMTLTAAAALSGFTARWELRPPPIMAVAFLGFALAVVFARGRLGEQIAMGVPVAALIAFQSFRFPLELLLHRAYTDGVMPIQMSFEGQNFDIVTGLLGLAIGGYFLAANKEVPHRLAWAFNIIGIGLLVNIVGVAIASMPIFAAFGPDAVNLWVAQFPFVWLPAVFVTFALFGHIVLTRRLLAKGSN
jgi:hypothetical protein